MAHCKAQDTAFLAYAAPTVSLLIGLQNCITAISTDKSVKETKNDIFAVLMSLCSSCRDWAHRARNMPSLP